ncbi:hypothetical protein [Clostridium grantii]|uniref:Uncharacterized protein n=1 Tax=Clostridium grantii DSM 8605 TaxID=1121316 RepID=A0A1M5TID7_9CLOT|nr:hypothetical protein [Clostridium grantii]SHH50459.1 hypothetical protein SAMN02745207_01322 [Clostridium grantii DSM 8605]
MKRENIYTSIFVISSFIAILAMLFGISNSGNYEKNNIEKSISMDIKEKIDNDNLIEESNQINFKTNDKEEKNSFDESNQTNDNNKDNLIEKNTDNTNIQNEEKKVDETKEEINKYDSSKTEIVEDVSVFKVSSSEIFSSLTLSDKEKLLVVGSKLSPIDYACMKEYLYMDDRDEGAKKAILLLKSRLSNEDYAKVKEIMDDYINIKAIEEDDF